MPTELSPDHLALYLAAGTTVILTTAHLCGQLARRVGQPAVVGQILGGVLLGPSVLGSDISNRVFPPQAQSALRTFGQIGVILYLLLVGLNLDTGAVRRAGKSAAAVALGGSIVPLAAGVALTPWLYQDVFLGTSGDGAAPSRLGFGLVVGALLTTTALPVMARILEERHLATRATATTALVAGAIGTVIMFLALAAALGLAKGQGAGPIALQWAAATAYILTILVVLPRALKPWGEAVDARGCLGPGSWVMVAALVATVAGTGAYLGLTPIPGAFLLGVVLPAREVLRRDLAGRLRTMTVACLLPIFLAYSGLNTDFTLLGRGSITGLVVLLAAAIAAKWAGTAVGARLVGIRGRRAHLLCTLMNCRGLLVLVVGLTAVEAGVISPTLQVGAAVIALVTTAMTGPLLDHLAPGPAANERADPDARRANQHREDRP